MPYNVAFTLGYGNYGNNNYKKKSKTKSTLKKAAVIGVTAYGAYQLGKLSNRFGGYGGGYGYGGHHYNYRQWNNWREIDGFMCRNDKDCNWIDQRLYCQDYELKFQPSVSILYKRSKSSKTCLLYFTFLKRVKVYYHVFKFQNLWFGGDAASIVGECACPHGMNWNDYELHCQTNFFSGTTLIIAIVIPLLIGLCCCCACVFLARKMFS